MPQKDSVDISFKSKFSQRTKNCSDIYTINPKDIYNILNGIDLFKGMKIEDLYFLPGTIDILTQRGCSNACLHCFVKARNKFTSIRWEDFLRFTEGLKELKQRLGFDIFEIRREKYDKNRRDYTMAQGIYPYLDSDPIEIKSFDNDGNIHNISDFVKKYYQDLAKPLKVKTVGWDIKNTESQKSAEDLVKLLTQEKYKNACPVVIVSMHPFHKIMTKANKYLQKGDLNRYNQYRNDYVERMSNVLKTFLPLVKEQKLVINPQYAVGGIEGSGYTAEDTKKLCKDILTQLEKDCIKLGLDCSVITSEKNIEQNKFFEPMNAITSVARSQKQFLKDYSLNTYSFEKGNNNERKIIVSPFDIKHAFANEVSENIVQNIKHQDNFINEIVIDINPLIDSDIEVAEKNKLSRNRKKMFFEKVIYTINRFKDIENLVLRISYDNNSKYDENFANCVLKVLKNKACKSAKHVEFRETTKEQSIKNLKNSQAAFKEIIDNLDAEGKVRFVSQLRKGVNVDGQVYIPVINTRGFGEDYFENRTLIIDGLKFNFDNPQIYIFDSKLKKNKISIDRSKVIKLVEVE